MSRTAQDFLLEISQSPDDDRLKSVFADWLLERGDPLGELMALQLKAQRSDEDRSREQLLIKKYLDRWIPPEVFINLDRASVELEKGVLAGCRVAVRSPQALQSSLKHPAWATVRRLQSPPAELVDSCPHVEAITEVDEYVVAALVTLQRPIPRLKTLGVLAGSSGVLQRAFESEVLSSVRELKLGFPRWQQAPRPLLEEEDEDEARRTVRDLEPRRLGWLFQSALGRRLDRLVLHTGWLDLSAWLPQLEALNVGIREVQLAPMPFAEATNWWVRFVAAKAGVFKHVVVHPGSELNVSFSEGPVRELLATAPRGAFDRLELPEHLGWSSVRRLPCFERAQVS